MFPAYGLYFEIPPDIEGSGPTCDMVAMSLAATTAGFALDITPDKASYAVLDGDEVHVDVLDGGLGRRRGDLQDSTSIVTVNWILQASDFDSFMNWYENYLDQGSDAFTIPLIMDDHLITLHSANFVSGTFEIISVIGEQYTIQANLEVVPLDAGSDKDMAWIVLYGAYTSGLVPFLSDLNTLVNIVWPKTSLPRLVN